MDSSGMTAGELRVSNAEREPAIERLKEAYAEGRLDHTEFDMRMHLAMTAKTRNDLVAVLRDLAPAPAWTASPKALTGAEPTGEDRMLAAAAHWSGAVTLFVGPLVLLLLSGKRSAYVRKHALEALNFQLTLLLITIVTFGLGSLVYAVAWIASLIAGIVALSDKDFRYPWTLRPVK